MLQRQVYQQRSTKNRGKMKIKEEEGMLCYLFKWKVLSFGEKNGNYLQVVVIFGSVFGLWLGAVYGICVTPCLYNKAESLAAIVITELGHSCFGQRMFNIMFPPRLYFCLFCLSYFHVCVFSKIRPKKQPYNNDILNCNSIMVFVD